MKRLTASTIAGWILIGIGTLLVLANFDMLSTFHDAAIAVVFAAGGIGFLILFAAGPTTRWASIPGFALLGLATVTGLQAVAPEGSSLWAGPLFLGMLSLGFWAIYLVQRAQWWPIIPGGVLLTLAIVSGVSPGTDGRVPGTIFWLGLALTFGLLYLVEAPHRRATWPLIPAAVCVAFGVATFGAFAGWIDIIWPVALIAGGLALVVRSARTRERASATTDTPPTTLPQHKEEAYEDQTLPQPH